MHHTCALMSVLLLAPLAPLRAADFVLVAQDVPPTPIVVLRNAPPRTRDATETPADYIGKMCGQQQPVIDGQPNPVPQRAIWVGVQPAVKRLFPQADFDFQHPEETLIVADDKHLVIAGRDRWHPAHMQAEIRLAMKTGVQQ